MATVLCLIFPVLCTVVAESKLPEARAHHMHEVKQISAIQQEGTKLCNVT